MFPEQSIHLEYIMSMSVVFVIRRGRDLIIEMVVRRNTRSA